MMLSVHRLALLALSVAACAGKGDSSSPEATPPPTRPPPPAIDARAPATPAAFYSFASVSYHWELGGYEVLLVDADGRATYVGPTVELRKERGEEVGYPVWYRHDWSLSEAEQERFVNAIEAVNAQRLDDSYVDPNIEDGQNVDFVFRTKIGGSVSTKRVHCGNQFPPAIQTLRKHLADSLLAGPRERLEEGKRLTAQEADAFWKPLTEHVP